MHLAGENAAPWPPEARRSLSLASPSRPSKRALEVVNVPSHTDAVRMMRESAARLREIASVPTILSADLMQMARELEECASKVEAGVISWPRLLFGAAFSGRLCASQTR
jgi:hypothetical protein